VLQELRYLGERGVQRINVVDPVFNSGIEYLAFLEEALRLDVPAEIVLQARFENIIGQPGSRFLELCSRLNVRLEFGLQTIHAAEFKPINRGNNLEHITSVLARLVALKIPFEVSLIYGLPNQTVSSFGESIAFLRERGCSVIKAFPLMLLRGTPLWVQRRRWALRERSLGPYRIPTVVSSASFDETEWQAMRLIADGLSAGERY
jgi:radical SAM superfamily enzyme YgiQ (UPF0313 family)